MDLNSSSQLAGWIARDPLIFQAAGRLLFMPDLFHFLLSGVACTEQSIASTSQLLDMCVLVLWSGDVLSATAYRATSCPPSSNPARARAAPARNRKRNRPVRRDQGRHPPAAHDTASAVRRNAALKPAELLSLQRHVVAPWFELDHAIVSEEARAADFTNEHGVSGTTLSSRM